VAAADPEKSPRRERTIQWDIFLSDWICFSGFGVFFKDRLLLGQAQVKIADQAVQIVGVDAQEPRRFGELSVRLIHGRQN
jgi:hypothetical protein